ncbi:uncharacterized protein L969DRAFT_85520 [Mixia osmundae IAM 14324]|nr:uncharacterized protein L969DRAFT_85520 [Mixia osmundae IAM 14324]KEI41711.1 hypothetical protein L969DRAFT_85520 [Mixia osmundae IAM 14324]
MAKAPAPKPQPRFAMPVKAQAFNIMSITPSVMMRWAPTLAVWGVAAAGGILVYASSIPKFQQDVLLKVPLVKEYYKDTKPDEDKPF